MNPVFHQCCNDTIAGPKGVPECVPLAIHKGPVNGMPAITSFWKPEPEELALLNAGQKIALVIYGHGMPMVWVAVAPEETDERRN